MSQTTNAKRCATCKHVRAFSYDAYNDASQLVTMTGYQCRRFPPGTAGFPILNAADWCSEHALIPTVGV